MNKVEANSSSPIREPLLRMESISKAFSGRYVLTGVQFTLASGETHVLAGENGAGKSTLVKIISGVHAEYEGAVYLAGEKISFHGAHDAARHGISMIHQEMSLIPAMSVADNIFLGREQGRLWVDQRTQREKAKAILAEVGLAVDLSRPVAAYPLAVQQMIEIAKALTFDARILIMDEPTSALNEPEVERLFAIIANLKRNGCGIIYISHKMEEIYRIADRITVLRDGRHIGSAAAADLPREELVRWMVGRKLTRQFPQRQAQPGGERLKVERLFVPDRSGTRTWAVEDVSFSVKAGELLGIAGLQGSGNSQLFRGLFGVHGRLARGTIWIDGRPASVLSPRHAIAQGMALLTNDRKRDGLVAEMNVIHNITRASLKDFSPWGWLRPRQEAEAGERQRRNLNIRAASLHQEVRELSGGNQQKVVLANWLETRPRILLLDEPTRGIDVGAKHELYELMNQWGAAGMAILLITSELPELLAMSDRILVMHRGRLVAELARDEATQERIVRAAMGETAA